MVGQLMPGGGGLGAKLPSGLACQIVPDDKEGRANAVLGKDLQKTRQGASQDHISQRRIGTGGSA